MSQLEENRPDIYRLLARHLDSLPAGFPPTENGVELKILRKLFIAAVDLDRCIGCGDCVPVCDYEALSIKQKEPAAQTLPPETMVKTFMQMARERGKI